ncbi:DNA primase [Patescibacteria group bacterium]|nr:DNA primase [Patescibacteria group bacterium]
MDHLEEIRARIGIEELVGSYVQLKKAGRNLRGLCPFHGEKTPSFMVSPEKGIAYCFGCHQGGDIFKFIQLIENVDFTEAVKILAQKTNVTLPQKLPELNNKRLKSIEINQWSVRFFQEQLEQSPAKKEYFLKRGLTEEAVKKFQLGFAPDSFDQLKNYLLQKGFEPRELIDAAVVSQRSIADKNSYDRFRNRLIFPIFDHQDNPVGFSGRIMGDGEPKYLNSPESPAYNKSLVLYGLNWGKDKVKKEDLAIFVEGYMDVIAAHQAGNENTVATCGTALTPQQLKLIKRYTQNIAFAFDQDSAGMDATFRGIELAQMADVNIQIIRIPEGKDPDECIQKNPEAWKNALKNPISVMDFYFDYTFARFSKQTMEGKRQIMDFLLPLIRMYKREVEQGIYLNRLAIELKTDVRFLWNDLKNTKIETYHSPKANDETKPIERIFSREEFLLGFIFTYPEIYKIVDENLINNIPFDTNTERFYNLLKKGYTLGSLIDIEHVLSELTEEERENISIYNLLIDEKYPDFPRSLIEKEAGKLICQINRKNIEATKRDCQVKLNASADKQDAKLLLNRLMEIAKLEQRI